MKKTEPKILKSLDQNKDQSYFLWQIKKKNLAKILFPVGDFETKAKVREFATQNDLITANKKDSQGLCFVGQTNVKEMLWQILGQKTGLILTNYENKNWGNWQKDGQNKANPKVIKSHKTLQKILLEIEKANQSQNSSKKPKNIILIDYKILKNLSSENAEKLVKLQSQFIIQKTQNTTFRKGLETKKQLKKPQINKNQIIYFYRILNSHQGAFVYTIGQRQGLGLSGGPWFVSVIDMTNNTVFVASEGEVKTEIYTKKILVKNLNWQVLPQ